MKTKTILTTLFLLTAGVQVSRAQYGMQVWHDGKYDVYFVNDGSTPKQDGERKAIDVSFQADEGTSGFSGEDCGKLVDGNVSTKWCFTGGEGNPSYVIFHASNPIFVTGYEITTANDNSSYPERKPKSWTFYGSTDASNPGIDGASWEVIASVVNDTKLENANRQTYTYTLSGETDKAYQYFKWVITAREGGGSGTIQVSEFKPTYTEALIGNHTASHIYVDSIKYISFVSRIELSQKAVELVRNTTCQLTAHVLPDNADQRSVVWASDRTDVATVDENGLVTAAGIGNAVITATATDGSDVQATCEVTVVKAEGTGLLTCPDSHHPHAIDLGLPSGNRWSCCNVGASSPEEYGGHYAWGETWEKEDYSSETYTYYNQYIGDDISGTMYDAAYVCMGTPFCMPTLLEQKELIDNCLIEWTTLNDTNGLLLTGSNGGTIFLPAAGDWNGKTYESEGIYGSYWSSNPSSTYLASGYCFYSSGRREFYSYGIRHTAQSIRAVCR